MAYAAPLYVETGKTVNLFLKHAEFLFRQLAHKELLSEARVAGILVAVFNLVHSLDEIFFRYTKRITEFCGVKTSFLLVHHHHNVVGILVVDQQLAVSVGYYAARRKLHLLQKGVAVGVFLVVVAHYLQREKAYDVDGDDKNSHSAYNITSVLKSVFLVHNPAFPALSELSFSYVLYNNNQYCGQHRASADVFEPLQPVEEVERLNGEE